MKNSFQFVELVNDVVCRPGDVRISCDVASLFTRVPIDLAIQVAEERLLNDSNLDDRTLLNVTEIISLLKFCLNASDFVYEGTFFHQKFGCPMGSPVSMVIANLVMENVESRILSNTQYDILIWRRFVDDTWAVIPADNVKDFFKFINSIEASIKFTIEEEDKNNSISFLDVQVTRNSVGKLKVALHEKETSTGRYLPFDSHHPACQKRSVISSLAHRANFIASNNNIRNKQRRNVCSTLNDNGYPLPLVRTFVYGKKHSRKNDKSPPRNKNRISLPYVAGISEQIGSVLNHFNLKSAFKPCNKIKDFFKLPKDNVEKESIRGIVYSIPCADCDKVYVGQTGNSFKTRIGQHRSALRLLHPEKSALAEHSILHKHQIGWDNAKVLEKESNYNKRLFLEAYHSRKVNSLNRVDLYIPDAYRCF